MTCNMTIFKISCSRTSPKQYQTTIGSGTKRCTGNVDEYMRSIYKNDPLNEYIAKVQLVHPNDCRCRRKMLLKGGDTQELVREKERVGRNGLVLVVSLDKLSPMVKTIRQTDTRGGRKMRSKFETPNFDRRFQANGSERDDTT